MIFRARATRGLGRPSLDARSSLEVPRPPSPCFTCKKTACYSRRGSREWLAYLTCTITFHEVQNA